MAKQRVVQFRKVEEEKLLNDTKRTHEEQVSFKKIIIIFNLFLIENTIRERSKR